MLHFYFNNSLVKNKNCDVNCNKKEVLLPMRRKNTTTQTMKKYIITALLLLMEKEPFSQITIGQITDKAGVNRSTYYRHFHSKEEIIKTFFCNILKQSILSLPETSQNQLSKYLSHIFKTFYQYKKEILIIHKNQLSYLLLPALNDYFLENADMINKEFETKVPLYYHTGGIFNNFILWFEHDMEPKPEIFAQIASEICLPNIKPLLLSNRYYQNKNIK